MRTMLGCLFTFIAGLLYLGLMIGLGTVYDIPERHYIFIYITMGLFSVMVGSAVFPLFRYARRLCSFHALEALKKDTRPPVLLLRAFRDDFHTLPGYEDRGNALWFMSPLGTKTFEEFLYARFSACGPVIAVGRPGEKVPPLGASRLWVENAKWKDVVDELLHEAQYVVMVMGDLPYRAYPGCVYEGLAWEVERVFRLHDYRKLILVMPPVDESTAARRWERYRDFSYGRLPPYKGGEIAAAFESRGTCRVARVGLRGWFRKAYKRKLSAYQLSLKISPRR